MNIIGKFKQTAVLWTKTTLKATGYTNYNAGVEIKVRWESKRELFVNEAGEDQFSRAIVYMMGTQSISVDDKLYLGTLASLPTGADTKPNLEVSAYPVIAIDTDPSLKNTQSIKTVRL